MRMCMGITCSADRVCDASHCCCVCVRDRCSTTIFDVRGGGGSCGGRRVSRFGGGRGVGGFVGEMEGASCHKSVMPQPLIIGLTIDQGAFQFEEIVRLPPARNQIVRVHVVNELTLPAITIVVEILKMVVYRIVLIITRSPFHEFGAKRRHVQLIFNGKPELFKVVYQLITIASEPVQSKEQHIGKRFERHHPHSFLVSIIFHHSFWNPPPNIIFRYLASHLLSATFHFVS